MSTRKGANVRTRPQKHKNRTAFKNDLHDKTHTIKFINSIHVSEVCEHCKSVIEWKIKYKKYKPLSQPRTCNKCGNRNVKKAYHVLCRECALKDKVCAKCNKSAEVVSIEPPQPTPQEKVKLEAEMSQLIKSLSERKRRTFLRYMQKGKKNKDQEENQEPTEDTEECKKDTEKETEKIVARTVPHTREELLHKIELLKLSKDDEDDDDDDDFFDTDDDDEDGNFNNDVNDSDEYSN